MTAGELLALSTPESRLVALPGGLVLLGLLGPSRVSRVPSLCLVRRLVGHCPTCGVTRAVAALVRGDVSSRPRRALGAAVLAACVATIAADARTVATRAGG